MSTKNKIIQKKTRSQINKANDYKSIFNSLHQTQKIIHGRGKTINKQNKHNDQRLNYNNESQNQQIFINLNLGQYGFDNKIQENYLQQIMKIVDNCEIFYINPNVNEVYWKQLCSQITNIFQSQQIFVHSLINQNKVYLYEYQSQNLMQINKKQSIILQCMHQVLSRIKQGSIPPGLIGMISNQATNLRKFKQKACITLNTYREIQKKDQIKHLLAKLEEEVALKTFFLGLQDLIIDQLNYFLFKQFQQNSRNGKLENPIKNWEEWALFIQKKRVRLRKANKFILHTACQFCLSSYTQQLNSLENCSQCHIRGHRLCLGTDRSSSRCGRCIYIRLSNSIKEKIPECFICSIKNLAPIKILSTKFAHIFCLMAHGFWNLSNSGIGAQNIVEDSYKNQKICKFCNKSCIYYGECTKCGEYSHYLCAYMNGSCFQIQSPSKILINCCELNSASAQKFAYQRKYILNYNNLVFKKLVELQKANKKSIKYIIKQKNLERINNNYTINEQQDNQQHLFSIDIEDRDVLRQEEF